MATIFELSKNFKSLINGFEKEALSCMAENIPIFEEYVREQLFHGIGGDGRPLRYTYLNDPFFRSPDAGRWKNNAKGYMYFKNNVLPHKSGTTYLNLPPKKKSAPDLYIRGDFHKSIKGKATEKGVMIGSNVSFASDIESKYGNIIYGLSPEAKKRFIDTKLYLRLKSYVSKFI